MFSDTGLGHNGFEVLLNYLLGIPDLASIDDAHLTVWFKLLLKTSATTREKALRELDTHFGTTVTDSHQVLVAWTQMYPKLATDVSRPVRVLAHQVHAKIVGQLGKRYARFLQDTAPVWLAGTVELDRVVSRAATESLVQALGLPEKVARLWSVFEAPLAHYVHTVMLQEEASTLTDQRLNTAEEVNERFGRVVHGCILLAAKLVAQHSRTEELAACLASKQLWEDFLPGDDLVVKRAALVLLTTVAQDGQWALEQPLATGSRIAKALVKCMRLKVPKNTSSHVLLPVVVPLVMALRVWGLKVDSQFWLNGKKPHDRLVGLLKLGPCGSDASYHSQLAALLTSGLPAEVLDVLLETHADEVLLALADNVLQERLVAVKEHALAAYNKVMVVFAEHVPSVVPAAVAVWVLQALAAKARALTTQVVTCVQALPEPQHQAVVSGLSEHCARFWPSGGELEVHGTAVGASPFVENTLRLWKSCGDTATAISTLEQAAEQLAEFMPEEPAAPTGLLHYVSAFIACGWQDGIDEVHELVLTLPGFIEPGVVAPILEVLQQYACHPHHSPAVVAESINDAFLKILLVDDSSTLPEMSLFLHLLPKLSKGLDLAAVCPEVLAYLRTAAAEYRFGAQNDMFQLLDENVVVELMDRAWVLDNQAVFVEGCVGASSFDSSMLAVVMQERGEPLMRYLWQLLDSKASLAMLRDIEHRAASNKDTLQLYTLTLYAHLGEQEPLEALAAHLQSAMANEVLARGIIPWTALWDLWIAAAVGEVPDLRLALSNPVGVAALMVARGATETFNHPAAVRLVLVALAIVLLLPLARHLTGEGGYVEVLARLAVAAEVAGDLALLLENVLPAVVELPGAVSVLVRAEVKGVSLEQAVQTCTGASTEPSCPFIGKVCGDDTSIGAFYKSRVLSRVVAELCPGLVEALPALDLSRLVRKPFVLAGVVAGCAGVLASPHFLRVRNAVAAELIGMGASQAKVQSLGVVHAALLALFLPATPVAGFEAMPGQRLAMVLATFRQWLDLDWAYDPLFAVVRAVLCAVLSKLVLLSNDLLLASTALEVCRDTLGVVGMEDAERTAGDALNEAGVALVWEFTGLRLFQALERAGDRVSSSERESMVDDIVGVLANHVYAVPTGDVVMCQDLVARVLERLPARQLVLHVETLARVMGSAVRLELVRVCAAVLLTGVREAQREFVVEYELQNTQLDEEDAVVKAALPPWLLALVAAPPQLYLEEEDPCVFGRYVYLWCLVLAHFDDITHRIRALYTRELKEHERVLEVLLFVATQLDLKEGGLEFVRHLDPQVVPTYAVGELVDSDAHVAEFLRLLAHVYYQVLRHLGSSAQQWYNLLKDRQLRQLVEQFTVKFVLGWLIALELDRVEAKLASLKQLLDENLSVKVNRSAHEIRQVYRIDEQTMEVSIKIPSSYPLAHVLVEGPQRLGVKETVWKAWLLALQRVVTSQNGTIVEAMELFNRNVLLHFSGFEECAICYAILHQDHLLPSKTCPTCNNKFHSGCLYKWFKLLGSSTCPLCRGAFNFRR